MQDGKEPAAARVRAAECLLDRAWGRAEMTANVKLPRDVRDLSREELLAIIGSYADADEEQARASMNRCIERADTKQVIVC